MSFHEFNEAINTFGEIVLGMILLLTCGLQNFVLIISLDVSTHVHNLQLVAFTNDQKEYSPKTLLQLVYRGFEGLTRFQVLEYIGIAFCNRQYLLVQTHL